MEFWHHRVGHSNVPVAKEMIAAGRSGTRERDRGVSQTFSACVERNQTNVPCNGSLMKEIKEILLHADVRGSMQHGTFTGHKYFMVMVSAPYRYVCAQLLRSRVIVLDHCLDFIAWVERNAASKVRRLHIDTAPEFIAMKQRVPRKGIEFMTSSPYTLQSNGLVEKANRTLLEKTRSMMRHAG